jgi:phosphoglycerol geranylgeranyltransferase
MNVEKHYYRLAQEQGAIVKTLIDPREQAPKVAGVNAKRAEEAGADIILVGGSVGAGGLLLDLTIQDIKDKVDIPVVLFPGNINGVSKLADAMYFMTMINSESTYWNSEAQVLAAPFVKDMGIETISTAYIILEPGGAVGWVGRARPVPRNQPEIAGACALAGKLMGNRFILTDSGSGAPSPAPELLVSTVKKYIGDTLYIYGGGIKSPQDAAKMITAGADAIQIGTAFEKSNHPEELLKGIVKAAKEAGRKKL